MTLPISDVCVRVVAGLFDWVLIEIKTESGLVGWGEASTDRGVLGVLEQIKGSLIGEDALNINLILTKLTRAWSGMGSRSGTFLGALSGIEMALWDLMGKQLDTPVYSLLGGKLREEIDLYIDCHTGTEYSPRGFRERALEVVDWGFTALKFDLDDPVILKSRGYVPKGHGLDQWNRRMSPKAREYKASLVRAVREAVGPDVELGIDLHWYYPPGDLRAFAKAIEPYDVAFLEDPIYPENDIEALRELSARVDIPLLYGELLYNFNQFQRLIESQAVTIIAPEITRAGGIRGCLEVARFADEYGILVSPHNVNSMVATAALAHVASVIPNLYYVEYRYREDDWWDSLVVPVDGKPFFEAGRLRVPTAPGLGFDVNRALIEEKTIRAF